jgi:hypothetical protein
MTILYARPNLVDLGDVTGYSLTSGGPSANKTPTNALDTLVFDSNSGPRRSIAGYLPGYAVQLLMSVPMDIVGTVNLTKDSVLMGTVGGVTLQGYNGNSFDNIYHLDASQCVVGSQGLAMSGDTYWQLQGNFTTIGQIRIYGGTFDEYLYCTDGSTITCNTIFVTGSSPTTNGTLFTGNGINLVVTGADNGTSVTCNIANINAPGQVSITFTDKSSTLKTTLLGSATWNFTNDTGNAQGTGGVQFNGAVSFGTFNGGKGAINIFNAGSFYTATTWNLDGSGQYTVLKSTSTTPVQLGKPAGGTIAANFCNFNYINCATSPLTLIRATNSKLTGGGTGITLVGMTSRFMPFF